MKIDLTIEGGRVTATFDAQSEQARQALRDGVDGLKRSIEEAGLTVKSIDVVGTTPLPTTNPPSGRDDRSSQTAGDATGQHGQNGEHSGGKERREHSAPWAQEQPEAQVSPEAVGLGGVWAEEDGSASGLLRLRVDAVV
jgi:flagellar hook-length control protein FliK